ncbi:hypothetical protein HXX76_013067 [Chlamydomonas incerta]|uniref:Wax synthase domain-containing protein n=1 Tax=Chlamydomonas incerta TaxID=51695 RepID=A0A835VSM7_CHLIN|nr:hypothetical protein HXX76_013067 [Chlamydomonas incerta]|eukprot:KAG2426310.1 hypothetical protein HXX76_013067 [Chlamydomonas incerta]
MSLHLVAASSIALAVGSFYAARRLQSRGVRAIVLLAVAAALFALPIAHGRDDPLLAQSLCCILSMSAFKALALAQGRGCLAKPDLDLWTFLGVMLLPVIPLPCAPERSKHGALALRKVRSGLIKLASFAGLVASTLWATHRVERMAASPAASPLTALLAPWLLLACHWGGGVALMLEVDGCGDLTDAAALAAFGVAAEPHFDRVWLSSSFSELWARRWNLTVSSVLKAAFYDPAMEGRLFADSPSSAAKAPSPSSAAAASPAASSPATPFQAPATPLAAAVAAAHAATDARPSRADMAAWAATAGADTGAITDADINTTTCGTAAAGDAAGEGGCSPQPHTASPASSQRSLSDAGSSLGLGGTLPSESEWSAGRSSTVADLAPRSHSRCFKRDSVTSADPATPEKRVEAAVDVEVAAATEEKAAAHGSELRRRHQHHQHQHQHADQHHRPAAEPAANSAKPAATAPPASAPPAPPSIARSSGSSTSGGRGGGADVRLRRFLALLLTFFTSGVWHELVAFTMTGRTTGGSWLLLFTLQAIILTIESELRKATRRAGIRVPLWASRVMTMLLFMSMLSLLWYPPMLSTGMIDALVSQGDRAAAAGAAAAARLEAALLPAVAAVMPAGGGAEGVRAWLLSGVAAS